MRKVCTKCKQEKDIELFHIGNGRKGRRADCIECRLHYAMERGKKPEVKARINKYNKNYHRSIEGLSTLLLVSCRRRAKIKGWDCDIDYDWLTGHITPLVCEATGMKLTLEISETMDHTYNRPSIDRIDSDRGYTKDNCQIVSVIYNRAKGAGTYAHVLEMSQSLMDGGIG